MDKLAELKLEERILDGLVKEAWSVIMNAEFYGSRASECYQLLRHMLLRLRIVREEIAAITDETGEPK